MLLSLLSFICSCKLRSNLNDSSAKSIVDPVQLVAFHDTGEFVFVLDCKKMPTEKDDCYPSERVVPIKTEEFYKEWDNVMPKNGPSFALSILGSEDLETEAQEQINVHSSEDLMDAVGQMKKEGKSDIEIKNFISMKLAEEKLQRKSSDTNVSDRTRNDALWVRYIQKKLRTDDYVAGPFWRSADDISDQKNEKNVLYKFTYHFSDIFGLQRAQSANALQVAENTAEAKNKVKAIDQMVIEKTETERKKYYAAKNTFYDLKYYEARTQLEQEMSKHKCHDKENAKPQFCSTLKTSLSDLKKEFDSRSTNLDEALNELINAEKRLQGDEYPRYQQRILELESFEFPILTLINSGETLWGVPLPQYNQYTRTLLMDNFFKRNPQAKILIQGNPDQVSQPGYLVTFITHIDGIRLNSYQNLENAKHKVLGEPTFTITYAKTQEDFLQNKLNTIRVKSRWAK